MRLRQIEAFRATILTGSMSQAAVELNISQPTISRLIAALEHSIGFKLFERGRRSLTPTPGGVRLFEEMDEIEDALRTLRAVAADIKRDRTASLKMLTTPALGMTVLPAAAAAFTLRHPEVELSITQSGFPEMFKSLHRGTIDIAFSNKLINLSAVRNEELITTRFICALPPGHRLSEKEVIEPDDLRDERIIALEGSELLAFLEHSQLFEVHKITRFSRISTGYSSIAYALVKEGAGVGLLEPFSRGIWEAQGVEIRRFEPALEYSYVASFSENSQRSELCQSFFDDFRKMLMKSQEI